MNPFTWAQLHCLIPITVLGTQLCPVRYMDKTLAFTATCSSAVHNIEKCMYSRKSYSIIQLYSGCNSNTGSSTTNLWWWEIERLTVAVLSSSERELQGFWTQCLIKFTTNNLLTFVPWLCCQNNWTAGSRPAIKTYMFINHLRNMKLLQASPVASSRDVSRTNMMMSCGQYVWLAKLSTDCTSCC